MNIRILGNGEAAICGCCGQLWRDVEWAERCCQCAYCKKVITDTKSRSSYHQECLEIERQRQDKARLEAAEKLETWDGFVYLDGHNRDGYFESLQELVEYLEDNVEVPVPEYVHVCDAIPFPGLDLDNILDNLTTDMFEDAIDHLGGVDELGVALKAFNEKNADVISYEVDYKRAVRVPHVNRDA